MDLYEAMKKRKSVRKYSDRTFDAETLCAIKERIAALRPLRDDIRAAVDVVSAEDMPKYFGGLSSVKAPCYLVFTSEDKPLSGENIGFLGEQLVVSLCSLGIGTCWLGGFKPKPGAFPLPYVISAAAGYAQDSPWRSGTENIGRKPLEDICLVPPETDFAKDAVAMVRIAPSGINRQPWRFVPDGDTVHLYCEQPVFAGAVNFGGFRALVPAPVLRKLQGVDCGIALAHILICAKSRGRDIDFPRLPECEFSQKKLHYIASAVLKAE